MKVHLIIDKIKALWKKNEGTTKNMSKKEKWIMLFLFGLLAAVLLMPMDKKTSTETALEQTLETNEQVTSKRTKNMNEYEAYLSEQLVEILEQLDGAGKVDAWVTVSESEEFVFVLEGTEENTSLNEEDSVGGIRNEEKEATNKTVVVDSNGNPYITKTIQPKVEGVFVVAEGAGDSVIKKNISDAVEVLFGIDAHRIKVAKKKLEE